MEDKIYEIIKSWAGISTWYTNHPLDQRRFIEAMHDLISELGTNIDIDAFKTALRRHAENNAPILGTPKSWDEPVAQFTIKAETIISYEQAR